MSSDISQLIQQTDGCLTRDRHRLRMALSRYRHQEKKGAANHGKRRPEDLSAIARKIDASRVLVEKRQAGVPSVTYPPELPMTGKVEEIKTAIAHHQVVIVAGETGSGKTTQLPKICLDIGRGIKGMIGHTQPRRLAARTVSSRIAEELGLQDSSGVAYQVRFQDFSDESTYIKLMTDGILLSETREDPFLNKYDTIIIDEAHERSLNIDFLLGYLKRLLPRRPDLKVIVTSATIDVEKFSDHFDKAPVIEVSGRTYPVDVLYQSPDGNESGDLNDQILRALRQIQKLSKKSPLPYRDVLVFLSGEKEIRDAAEAIRKDRSLDLEVLPLYARLSNNEQNRVFQAHGKQRVVLATNVAETSLTVPRIGYVIDSGVARISRYSIRSKIQRLPIEPISKASANQRAGRCGRLCPGTCIRLYSEEDFHNRPDFTDTEIIRTNLASVILQMLVLRFGDIEEFPFVDPPEGNAVRDGFRILEELGAVTNDRRITRLGRQMSRFPVDPRFARILLAGDRYHCLQEILVIVSALSIQDPRERPLDKQQAADEAHRRFKHPESDFLAWTALWEFFEEQRQQVGRNKLGKLCRQNFLSYLRMNEWRDVHRQLRLVSQELALTINSEPASYEQIHQALLAGLVSNVANRLDDNSYLGARNRKFRIFPGSFLHGKKYSWILAAELVETSQLYARMNAMVEAPWIEMMAGSLIKKHYSEPHWEKGRGKVIAFEKVSLYGLVLVDRRKVVYGSIDPVTSRELFIREGLACSQVNTKLPFYRHNSRLISEIENLEDKTRRKDLLVREEDIYQLYDDILPEEVIDQTSLERWYKKQGKGTTQALFFTRESLLNTQDDALALEAFPDQLQAGHLTLDLDYRFEPGAAADGVSVDVPVSALTQLHEEDLDWLVPGMLREKCIALVKALPKPVRKNFVPVPDHVDRAMPAISKGQGDLKAVLAHELQRLTAVSIPQDSWTDFSLPDHLKMNINILDMEGKKIGNGRDLAILREKFAAQSKAAIANFSESTIERTGLTEWDFDSLEEEVEIQQGGIVIKAWPALVDDTDSVSMTLADSPYQARLLSRAGVARLYMFRNRQQWKYLKKNVLQDARHLPAMNRYGGRDSLANQIVMATYQSAFRLAEELPRDRNGFDEIYDMGRGELVDTSTRLENLLYKLLDETASITASLKKFNGLQDMALQQDVNRQMEGLVHDGFLSNTPIEVLMEYPRYFKALNQRLEKYPRQSEKDAQWSRMLEWWWQRYQSRKQLLEAQHKSAEQIDAFRWMLEELRVSLFAQALGTRYPISEKRVEKAWHEME